MLTPNEILVSLQNYPQGYLKPDHIIFTTSNSNLLQKYKKLGAISNKDETFNDYHRNFNQIYCNEIGCSTVFDNISSYQSHYNMMHRFICSECKKSLPTDHLLDLHLSENHDSYFIARIERGERLYKCYLEECKEKFGNSSERKEHCIKQHKFPSNFRFDQIGCKHLLNKNDISGMKSEPDRIGVELKQKNKSRGLKMISFGHQKEKTFCHKSGPGQEREPGNTLEDMNTLKQALESV